MAVIRRLALILGIVALLSIVAGQAGMLAGSRPLDLGVRDGRLKPPSKTANGVSSQAWLWPGPRDRAAQIMPLPVVGDGGSTMTRLRGVVEGMPGARIIESRPDYLYVEFSSTVFGFVDDAEFWFDPAAAVIQLRSAARIGRKDFGVNRARIEEIRARLVKAP